MKKVLKSTLFIAVAAALLWLVPAANVFASDAEDFAELMVIFEGLLLESQQNLPSERTGKTREDRLALSANVSSSTDARCGLLHEFWYLLRKATIVHETARGCERAAQGILTRSQIAGAFSPTRTRHNFGLSFFNEMYYLALIDMFVDFTGIERELIAVEIRGCIPTLDEPRVVGHFDEYDNFTPVDEEAWAEEMGRQRAWLEYFWQNYPTQYDGEDTRHIPGWAIPMGTNLFVRRHNSLLGMGAMGHPRTNAGVTALSTSHGRFLAGDWVYAPAVTGSVTVPIGRIDIARFQHGDHVLGLDFSLIRMTNDFTVSRNIPGMGLNVTIIPTYNVRELAPVWMIGFGPRLVAGHVWWNPYDATVNCPSGGHLLFRGVIRTHQIPGQAGDSGAALVNRNSLLVAGTVFGRCTIRPCMCFNVFVIPFPHYEGLTR